MNIETYEQKKTKNITAIRQLDTWKTASRRLVLELDEKVHPAQFLWLFFYYTTCYIYHGWKWIEFHETHTNKTSCLLIKNEYWAYYSIKSNALFCSWVR